MRNIALLIIVVAMLATFITITSPASASEHCSLHKSVEVSDDFFAADYSVESVAAAAKTAPKLNKGTWEYGFRTVIGNGANCPVNFGESYHLIFWGQGSESLVGVIVDSRNGKVYRLPPARWGYAFREDNRTLLVDPVVPEFADVGPNFEMGVYYWDEGEKEFSTAVDPTATSSISLNLPEIGPVNVWRPEPARKFAVYGPDGDSSIVLAEAGSSLAGQAEKVCREAVIDGCVAGVIAPIDWTVYVVFCDDTMASVAVSPDNKLIMRDSAAQSYDIASCKVLNEI